MKMDKKTKDANYKKKMAAHKLNFETLKLIAGSVELGEVITSKDIQQRASASGYYVNYMTALLIKRRVFVRVDSRGETQQFHLMKKMEIAESDKEKILYSITADFKDINSIANFTGLSTDMIENELVNMVSSNELCRYVEGGSDKAYFTKVPLLSFIYKVKLPSDLISKTTHIDGKQVKCEKYIRQLGLSI